MPEDTKEVNAVNARDLHERLGSGRQFANWIQDRLEDFDEGVDFLRNETVKQNGSGGHNRVDYILTLDTAKHIAMLERNDAGKQIRQYFIEVEKRFVQKHPNKIIYLKNNSQKCTKNRLHRSYFNLQ